MKFIPEKICVGVLALLFMVPECLATTLSGMVPVSVTSETAARAKINAMNSARRQIFANVLSQYSNKDALMDLLQKSSDSDLIDLVTSTSVSNEQTSSTVYSANIIMNLDNDAVKKWLIENNVQNWVPGVETSEKFTAFIVVPNGISDWAELKRIARAENIEIETQVMTGNQIIAKMPQTFRAKFTAAARDAGWRFTDNSGVLQLWK